MTVMEMRSCPSLTRAFSGCKFLLSVDANLHPQPSDLDYATCPLQISLFHCFHVHNRIITPPMPGYYEEHIIWWILKYLAWCPAWARNSTNNQKSQWEYDKEFYVATWLAGINEHPPVPLEEHFHSSNHFGQPGQLAGRRLPTRREPSTELISMVIWESLSVCSRMLCPNQARTCFPMAHFGLSFISSKYLVRV